MSGAIVLDRQGGKPFLVRVGGQIVVSDEKDRMKNEVSNRVIRLPRHTSARIPRERLPSRRVALVKRMTPLAAPAPSVEELQALHVLVSRETGEWQRRA